MSTTAKKRVAPKSVSKAARKRGPSRVSPAAEVPATPQAPKKNILTAGIKALTHAHEEAVARQSRVFESLLGLGKGLVPGRDAVDSPVSTALDPFGIKKFEDVFDQRVARAMQRLAAPSSEVVARLEAEVAALREDVARLRTQLAKR